MTSVFNVSFRQNLERINSRVHQVKKTAEDSESFRRVLGDVEKGVKIPNQAKGLGDGKASLPSAEPGSDNLTNLGKDSLSLSRARLSPDYYALNLQFSLDKNNPKTVAQRVNAAGEYVKKASQLIDTPNTRKLIAPDGISGPKKPPEAPQITSVRRVEKSRNYSTDEIKGLITAASEFHGIDPFLSLAIAKAESALKPNAVSSDGHASKGIFQLLDSTGKDMMALSGLEDEQYEPFDPSLNALLGTRYLRRLHDVFSESTELKGNLKTIPARSAAHLEKLAVAAFNAGEGNVAMAQAKAAENGADPSDFFSIEPHLPLITRNYVSRVDQLKSSLGSVNPAKTKR